MVLPLIPLIGLALQAAPSIARWLGGSKAEETVKEVATVAEGLFGSNDPKAIEKKIAEDRSLYVQWQTKLAELAAQKDQREHEERLEEFKNTISARDNYKNSKDVSDWLAKSTVVAFFLINSLVIGAIFWMLIYGAPGSIKSNVELSLAAWGVVNAVLGWLNSKADAVYNFFLGSSRGSDDKTAAMSNAINKLLKNGNGKSH